MLIEFKIKNFASIKSVQTLSMIASADDTLEDYYIMQHGNLKLLKLAVLYGPNASGKTTILKALDFLRQLVLNPKNQKSDTLNFLPFQFDETSKKEPSWMQISFLQNQIKYDYEVLFTQKCVLEEKLHYYPKVAVEIKQNTDLKDYSKQQDYYHKTNLYKVLYPLLENALKNAAFLEKDRDDKAKTFPRAEIFKLIQYLNEIKL